MLPCCRHLDPPLSSGERRSCRCQHYEYLQRRSLQTSSDSQPETAKEQTSGQGRQFTTIPLATMMTKKKHANIMIALSEIINFGVHIHV